MQYKLSMRNIETGIEKIPYNAVAMQWIPIQAIVVLSGQKQYLPLDFESDF